MPELELKETIDRIGGAFEEFKKLNDERLAAIEKKGSADPLLTEAVEKANADIGELMKMKAQLELLEKKLARPYMGAGDIHPAEKKYSDRFREYVAGAVADIKSDETTFLRERYGQKSLNVSASTDGGFLVPAEVDRAIEKLEKELSPLRQLCNVVTTGSSEYKKIINKRGATAGWRGEKSTGGETSTPGFAEIEAKMGWLEAEPYITQEMIDDPFFNVEQFMAEEVAETFAEYEGDAFVNGNGINKPKGFLAYTCASTADGTRAFGQIQYVYTGSSGAFRTTSATVSPADDFIDAIYKMKSKHRAAASWIMNALTLAAVRKFKDNQGAYIWQPVLVAGQPSQLLGYPVHDVPDMPDIGADAYPVAFGDWKRGYTIVDRFGTRVIRDVYSHKPYVTLFTTKRVGGMLVNSEAIKLIKLGTS